MYCCTVYRFLNQLRGGGTYEDSNKGLAHISFTPHTALSSNSTACVMATDLDTLVQIQELTEMVRGLEERVQELEGRREEDSSRTSKTIRELRDALQTEQVECRSSWE